MDLILHNAREAVTRLAAQTIFFREPLNWAKPPGLIDVRPSEGTFIRPLVPGPLVEPISVLLERETGRGLEFLQVRKAPGGRHAAEAARRAKPADFRKVGSCMRRLTRISKAGGLPDKPDVGPTSPSRMRPTIRSWPTS